MNNIFANKINTELNKELIKKLNDELYVILLSNEFYFKIHELLKELDLKISNQIPPYGNRHNI